MYTLCCRRKRKFLPKQKKWVSLGSIGSSPFYSGKDKKQEATILARPRPLHGLIVSRANSWIFLYETRFWLSIELTCPHRQFWLLDHPLKVSWKLSTFRLEFQMSLRPKAGTARSLSHIHINGLKTLNSSGNGACCLSYAPAHPLPPSIDQHYFLLSSFIYPPPVSSLKCASEGAALILPLGEWSSWGSGFPSSFENGIC